MKKRSLLALVLAAALCLMCFSGCGSEDPASGEKDELLVAISAEPVTLDPADQNDSASSLAIRQLYDPLLIQDQEMNIGPGLAESWEFTDDTTLVLKLREDVKFHNGDPLTSADVIYSLERALENPKVSSFIDCIDIENSSAVDDYTVELKTFYPFVPLLSNLALPSICIVSKNAAEEAGGDIGTVPCGTGPFKLTEWVHGDRLEFERNEDYWGSKPAFSKMTFRVIPENANRAIELETGGVDIALSLAPNDGTRLQDNPDVRVIVYSSLSTTGIQLNTSAEPFNDVRVRQALNYACDYQAIGETVYEGYGQRQSAPMSTEVWGADEDLPPYDYDPEKAKQLLADAGYPDGLPEKIILVTNDNRQRIDIFEIMQNQLAQVGIESEIAVRDMATLASFVPGDYEVFMAGWGTTTGDPDYGLYQTFNSESGTANSARIQYYNQDVIDLLEAGRAETDDAKRLEIYTEAQEIIWDECPWIWLWQTDTIDGTASYVQGYVPHPSGYFQDFTSVTFSE